MRRIFLVIALVALSGCVEEIPNQPKPMPGFVVESKTDAGKVEAKIKATNCDVVGGELKCAQISNLEDLRHYKKEVQFLLNQLDEIEKRMVVNEQGDHPEHSH